MLITTSKLVLRSTKKPSFSFNFLLSFSNLKDRLNLLRLSNYNSIHQLYKQLRSFESTLDYQQWVKFKKLIHDTDKKVRKLTRDPQHQQNQILGLQSNAQNKKELQVKYQLDGSITAQYFYHKHTEQLYYKREIPYHKVVEEKPQVKTLSLKQVGELVDTYFQNDAQVYLNNTLTFQEEFSELMKLIEIRYECIEEILCRYVFEGYTEFSNQEENLFFKTEQKYKGTFKFQPITPDNPQNIETIKKFSSIVYKLSCMNQCRSKLQLASQVILTQYWKQLPTQVVSELLFCTSANGKDLHQITTFIDQFVTKLLQGENEKNYFSLLFYMAIAGVQSREILDRADTMLTTLVKKNKLNCYEKMILSAMVPYLSQAKQIDFVQFSEVKSQILSTKQPSQSDCLKNFKKFIEEKQYPYEQVPSTSPANVIAPYQMIEIEQKKFLCYSSLFYQPIQQTKSNGIAKLIQEYFNANNEKIKVINGKELAKLQKWTEKEEYLKSKMKGLTRPQIKKQRKFDFYSPRQQYFIKKQKHQQTNQSK